MINTKTEILEIIKNKNKLAILQNFQQSKNTNELSEKTGLDELTLSRMFKSFEKLSLIKKQEKYFVLTTTGLYTLKKFSGFQFLASNKDYFFNHSLDDIPQYLIQRIEELAHCETVQGIWPVSQRMREFVKNSTGFINCIFSEPHIQLAEPLYQKMQLGKKFQFLFGYNSKIPDCNELVEKLELNKLKSESPIEKRVCDKVITNLLVSDDGACLMLGDKKGNSDMINGIVGNDERFIQWCNDFFNFKWNQGEPFARIKITQ